MGMKTRAEIKMDAKRAFAAQRGTSIGLVLVPVLLGVIMYVVMAWPLLSTLGSSALWNMTDSDLLQAQLMRASVESGRISALSIAISLAVAIVSVLIEVALAGGFTRIFRSDRVSIMSVLGTIPKRWLRKLGAMLLMTLFVMLWYLLAFIPYMISVALITRMANAQTSPLVMYLPVLFMIAGMVLMIRKVISYSLVPYILSEYPDVTAREAVRLSVRMTRGHIGQLFVVELSFFGWLMLSALTFMILAVVYVGPYMQLTLAGYYVELRDLALRNGIISPEDVGDSEYATGT